MHYMRWRRTGDPGEPEPRRAPFGTGHITKHGYRKVRSDGKYIVEHRLVMERALGRKLHPHETVHHRNGDRLGNRIENLEIWVRRHPYGQRIADLVEWVCSDSPDLVDKARTDKPQALEVRLPLFAKGADECQLNGCSQPGFARGWCHLHYYRVIRTGDPGPIHKISRQRGTCEISGCGAPHYGKSLCRLHWERKRKGRPIDQPVNRTVTTSCRVTSCDQVVLARGLCATHYGASRRRGDTRDAMPCAVDRCDSPVWARGYCEIHYRRMRRRGDPGPAERLRAPHGMGSVRPDGYRRKMDGGRNRFEHHEVMEMVLGRPLKSNEEVHHLNGNRLDNRPENLELWVTRQPVGSRVEDIVRWLVRDYPEYFGDNSS